MKRIFVTRNFNNGKDFFPKVRKFLSENNFPYMESESGFFHKESIYFLCNDTNEIETFEANFRNAWIDTCSDYLIKELSPCYMSVKNKLGTKYYAINKEEFLSEKESAKRLYKNRFIIDYCLYKDMGENCFRHPYGVCTFITK